MVTRNRILLMAVVGSTLLLAGCITPGEMQARHAATCYSYGFTPGSEGYAACMLQLDLADHGYTHHGVGASGLPYPPPPPPPPPPADFPQTPAQPPK